MYENNITQDYKRKSLSIFYFYYFIGFFSIQMTPIGSTRIK